MMISFPNAFFLTGVLFTILLKKPMLIPKRNSCWLWQSRTWRQCHTPALEAASRSASQVSLACPSQVDRSCPAPATWATSLPNISIILIPFPLLMNLWTLGMLRNLRVRRLDITILTGKRWLWLHYLHPHIALHPLLYFVLWRWSPLRRP